MKTYKILENGKSCHGGTMEWDLPKKDGNKWIPGAWMESIGPIEMCRNGIHITVKPFEWYTWKCTCYESESDSIVSWNDNKAVCRRARLIRPILHPKWWTDCHKFVDEIPKIKFFSQSKPPLKKWKLSTGDDLTAAWSAALDAARGAARDADLKCSMILCSDLNIDKRHIKHTNDRWKVWERGYRLACDVNGILYVYSTNKEKTK